MSSEWFGRVGIPVLDRYKYTYIIHHMIIYKTASYRTNRLCVLYTCTSYATVYHHAKDRRKTHVCTFAKYILEYIWIQAKKKCHMAWDLLRYIQIYEHVCIIIIIFCWCLLAHSHTIATTADMHTCIAFRNRLKIYYICICLLPWQNMLCIALCIFQTFRNLDLII